MALLVGLVLVLPLLAFLLNNVSCSSRVSRADFAQRLERARGASRDWVLGRDAAPLEEVQARWSELRNPALLHMLVDAAEMAGEDNFKQFALAIQSTTRESWWSRMVDPHLRFVAPPPAALAGLRSTSGGSYTPSAVISCRLRPKHNADSCSPKPIAQADSPTSFWPCISTGATARTA